MLLLMHLSMQVLMQGLMHRKMQGEMPRKMLGTRQRHHDVPAGVAFCATKGPFDRQNAGSKMAAVWRQTAGRP